ncbi:hypothetical protein SOVF_021170 [Spinacia oleracea]|nr:hypothetical protein SOVF_021170 [Spinacia oleracea]
MIGYDASDKHVGRRTRRQTMMHMRQATSDKGRETEE